MKLVKLEIKNSCLAYLSIERREAYNALSRQVVEEIGQAIDQVAGNKKVRVLVIKSEKHFASGADIREMAGLSREEAKKFAFGSVFQKLADLTIPTVAAIEGYALGGGLELALACDLRIASADARLGFPEITLGIMPGAGGTYRLPRIIGEARAKELIFLGDSLSAGQAQDIGLVNLTVSQARFDETVDTLARCLSVRSPAALAAAKKAIEEGTKEKDLYQAAEAERERWSSLFGGPDQKAKMKAFLERRERKS